MPRSRSRRGLTLIELLVVIVIIAVLIGLLLPAVQMVRDVAARSNCQNNLRQIGLAVLNYESVNGYLPPNGSWPTPAPGGPYSVLVRILPYIEQMNLYQTVDLNASATSQPTITGQRISTYICPSDPNVKLRPGTPPTYPASYGASWGDWHIGTGLSPPGTNGAFPGASFPSQRGIRLADITDGTSNTAGMADVKTFQPSVANFNITAPVEAPASPNDVIFRSGGTLDKNTAHTSWAEGFGIYSALTFVFPPNTEIPYTAPNGMTFDIDWAATTNNGDVVAVILARSYHRGGVNALFMDGSVRFVTNSINQTTWRALGTRNGGEAFVTLP
jgi:prepilin-type N-terminal cleavage/methylation domain-containing protein/prepilin-type processing-associated H-X9-DG protein